MKMFLLAVILAMKIIQALICYKQLYATNAIINNKLLISLANSAKIAQHNIVVIV